MVERGCEALGNTEGSRWASLCLMRGGTGEKGEAFSGLSLPVQKLALELENMGTSWWGVRMKGLGGRGVMAEQSPSHGGMGAEFLKEEELG